MMQAQSNRPRYTTQHAALPGWPTLHIITEVTFVLGDMFITL
jgi:hypothetical protein